MNVSSSIRGVKYAIVEIALERGSVKHIERGLFKGLRIKENNPTYIWLTAGEDGAKMCNLTEYTIVSIETYDGQARVIVFFMSDKDEQTEAKAFLIAVKNGLEDLCCKEDPELIDTDKYENVPKDFGGTGITKVSPNHSSDVSNYSAQRTMGFQTAGEKSGVFSRSSYSDIEDPEPTSFKRETRKPSKTALEKLNAKLDLIAKGEYKCELPEIEADEKEDKLGNNNKPVDIDDPLDDPLQDYYDGLSG